MAKSRIISIFLLIFRSSVSCIFSSVSGTSSTFEEKVFDSVLEAMVLPLDDHLVHRGHGVFDTAIIINGIQNKMCLLGCFKPKFYKKSKSTTRYMKIRLDIVRKKRNAVVNFMKTDIVNLLNNGHDYNAYTRAEVLLEELRMISCYDLIEHFCDEISENLHLMLNQRECPEDCREVVSSLMYAAAWVPEVPELKNLRAVFTHRFGDFIASSVNHELVEIFESRRSPSMELKIQTVKGIAKEFSINWDSTDLKLMLLTSARQANYIFQM